MTRRSAAGVLVVVLLVIAARTNGASFSLKRSYQRNHTRWPKKTVNKVIVYTYGLTVAEVARNPLDRSLQYCKLTELDYESDCEDLVAKVNRPVRNICLKKMMSLISECQFVINEHENGDPSNLGEDTGFFKGFSTGIMPGTKWCGPGNIGKNYFDLGSDVLLDKCCRAHDHCPVKLQRWKSGYGQTNWSLYTKSLCDCDIDFYNCLINSPSPKAETVGDLYFNIMKLPCLKEDVDSKPSCNYIRGRNETKMCLNSNLMEDLSLISIDTELLYPVSKRKPEAAE